jgi:LPXTG-motif cell wall-anchored protein
MGQRAATRTASESRHPSADMMQVETAATGGERAAILAIIAASLGSGLVLLLGRRRDPA